MTRFLLKLSLILVAAFAVLSAAPRILGRTTPHNSTLAGFIDGCEGKPQPCWYGIVPGETKFSDVPDLLSKRRFATTIVENKSYDVVYYSVLLPTEDTGCNQIRVYQGKDDLGVDDVTLQFCTNLYLSDILFLVTYPGTVELGSDCISHEYAQVRYPRAGIIINNIPSLHSSNEISEFGIALQRFSSIQDLKEINRRSLFSRIMRETTKWEFMRVAVEYLGGCG